MSTVKQNNKSPNRGRPAVAAIVAAALMAGLVGGVGGTASYTRLVQPVLVEKQQTDGAKSEITHVTKTYLDQYLGSSGTDDSTTGIIMPNVDTDEIARQAADLVTADLINNGINGVATDAELQELESKLTAMIGKYEFSNEQVKDLAMAVAAIIEADLDSLNKSSDTETALSQAVVSNIAALEERLKTAENNIAALQSSVSALQRDVASLQMQGNADFASAASVTDLNQKYTDLMSKYSAQTDKISELATSSASDGAVLTTLQAQLEAMQKSLNAMQTNIQTQITALNTSVTRLENNTGVDQQVSDLKSGIEDKEKAINELTSQVKTLTSQIEDNNNQASDIETQISALTDEASKLSADIKTLSGTSEKNTSDINSLKDNEKALQEKITGLEADLKTANNEVSDLETQLSSLKAEAQEAINTLNAQMASSNSKIESLEADLKTANDNVSALETELENVKTTSQEAIDSLNTQLAAANERIGSLETDSQATNNEVKRLEQELEAAIQDANTSTSALEADLASAKDKVSSIESDLAQARSDLDTAMATSSVGYNSRLTSIETALSDAQASYDQQIQALEDKLTEAKTKSSNIEKELSDAQIDYNNKINTTNQNLAAAESRISTLESSLGQAGASITELQAELATTNTNLETLKTDHSATKERVLALEKDLATTKQSLTNTQNDVAVLQRTVAALETASANHETDIGTLQNNVSDLTDTLEVIKEQKADMLTLQNLINGMISSLGVSGSVGETTDSTAKINLASGALQTLKETCDNLSTRVASLEKRADDLEEKTRNIGDNVKVNDNVVVPFSFGSQDGVYGYYKADGTFVDFKSQSDIDRAGSDAMVGTATSAQVLSGYTFTNSTESGIEGEIPIIQEHTYLPGLKDQIIGANQYLNGTQVILGDEDLIKRNIKHNVDIFTITGTFTSDGTQSEGQTVATAPEIRLGYSAWVNGEEVLGSIPNMTVNDFTVTKGPYNDLKSGGTVTIPKAFYTDKELVITAGPMTDKYDVTGTGTAGGTGKPETNGNKVYWDMGVNNMNRYVSLNKLQTGNLSVASGGGAYDKLIAGKSLTIPANYYTSEALTVTAETLANQTTPASGKNAVTAATMLETYSGWVNGAQVNGTMPNKGAWSASISSGSTSVTIPAGYHNGSGKVSLTNQEKTVTSSVSAQTVTPDSGKVLSKVTVNALVMSGTYTPPDNGSRSSTAADMGASNTYRYVNTKVCYDKGYNKGVADADARVNKSSKSYTQGVTDADARANTSSTNYKTGYNKGVTDADNRANANSTNYKTGYNKGVTDADNRANANSTNYKTGYNAGYSAGRTQGQNDVKNSPNSYSLYTKAQYDANYNSGYSSGRTQGQNDVKNSPNSYSLYSSSQYTDHGNNKYNEGYNAGRTQGQNDVKANPGAYGISTGGGGGSSSPSSISVTVQVNYYGSWDSCSITVPKGGSGSGNLGSSGLAVQVSGSW